ncbi:3-galactosyl-N-acetylglucosaminide 4-alpha-L-fucosyltransferase FUT3-like [Rhinoderma darwinii]|uniref:3-galactosyl-N-acetylglucosaminide 4-alpha-L-fucosyltransferase FUT3-like n=1 Tax=Rhinoderma darwinii TaxID=43563 RepID=UPI003F6651A4
MGGAQLTRQSLEAHITVLPKDGKDPALCGSYRPISLLNTDLKWWAKALATRLGKLLPKLIGPEQTGFVGGRQVLNPNTRYNVQSLSEKTETYSKHENEKKHVILLWNWPFGDQFPLNQCPEESCGERCLFTDNRSFYNLADAVVIHHREVSTSTELLPQDPRPTRQYWIWFNLESPNNCPNLQMMNNLFNLTMSYRVDSDIFTPYGWLERPRRSKNFNIPEKYNLVAWVVSNWDPNYERSKYFEVLKHHLDIDVYGKHHNPLTVASQSLVLSKYKFYLAFESSRDTDYITEKLWKNAFLSGTVPIVLGPPRKNYERFIPQNSFIHVDDFSSPQELASYILQLDKDDKRYQAYFKWRELFQPTKPRGWDTFYCKVCEAFKNVPSYRTAPYLEEWFKNLSRKLCDLRYENNGDLLIDRVHRIPKPQVLLAAIHRDVIAQLHFYPFKEKMMQAARNPVDLPKRFQVVLVFTDLSAATLARRREFQEVAKILKTHRIPYKWVFPVKMVISKDGRKLIATSPGKVMQLIQEWRLTQNTSSSSSPKQKSTLRM